PDFYHGKGMAYPPEYGPLAAVTPGTPGGLLTMLAEYGKLSLADVLAPAIEMADGYPIEAQLADLIERQKKQIKEWPSSRPVSLPPPRAARAAPRARGRGVPPARPRRHSAQAGGGRAVRPRRRQEPQGGHPRRL